MRVDVGPLGGNLMKITAVMSKLKIISLASCLLKLNFFPLFFFFVFLILSSDNTAIPLTPSLASQCGISVKIDLLGNTLIYASLQNCFAHNVVT